MSKISKQTSKNQQGINWEIETKGMIQQNAKYLCSGLSQMTFHIFIFASFQQEHRLQHWEPFIEVQAWVCFDPNWKQNFVCLSEMRSWRNTAVIVPANLMLWFNTGLENYALCAKSNFQGEKPFFSTLLGSVLGDLQIKWTKDRLVRRDRFLFT